MYVFTSAMNLEYFDWKENVFKLPNILTLSFLQMLYWQGKVEVQK